MSATLAVAGLEKRYDGAAAVAGVTVEVAEGELLAVVGPSGSGKSTLLRLIAGLETPDAGTVVIGGRDVTGDPPARRDVAMVFQSFALFPHLDIEANIGFGLEARGVPAAQRAERVRAVAERLELDDLLVRRPAQLSGGERQRVALARGLVGEPRVLLLDEPLSNLDAQLRGRARAELRRIQRATGVTMVHVTHDQAEALTLGDRVAVLEAGRLAQVGKPDALYDHPADVFVARFLGTPPMNLVPGTDAAPLGITALPDEIVGFRPEHVRVTEGTVPPVTARVELVERAGHDVVTHLVIGELRVAARDLGLREGATTQVRVLAGGVRRFDAATGKAR